MEVAPLTESDQEAVPAFLELALGKGSVPRTREFWRWKHIDNPFGQSWGLVARANGEIVGLRVFMRWKWCRGAEQFEAARAVDTAVHPDWRRRGIFRSLTADLLNGINDGTVSFVFNTPNRASLAGYLKLGWQKAYRPPLLIRPLPGRFRAADAAGLISIGELLEAPIWHAAGSSAGCNGRLHTPKSKEYLDWRYGRIPDLRYFALVDSTPGRGAFLIARSRVRRGLREVSIAEAWCTDDSAGERSLRGLLTDLIKSARGDYIVACAPRGTVLRRALEEGRFFPLPRIGPVFVVRILQPHGLLNLCRSDAWHPSIGDLEIF